MTSRTAVLISILVPAVSLSAQTAPERNALAEGTSSPFRPKGGFELKDGLAEDGQRTLAAFPKNLGKAFIGVFAKDNLTPLLIGAAATGSASAFDRQARAGLIGQAPGLSTAASTAGGFTVMAPATLGLFAIGRFSHDTRFRAFSYDATQALIVNGVYSSIFKSAVHRERPDGSDVLSFPSGHSSSAFALATVAQKHYGWKVGVPSYVAASAIGLSRISNDRHYLSDVLAGATLGVIVGRTVARQNGELAVGRRRSFSVGPTTDASGSGVGLRGSLSW